MTVDVKVEGLKELQSNLGKLEKAAQGKALRFATRKAAMVIVRQAKENFARYDDPATPQHIAENVGLRYSTRFNKATGDHQFKIGVAGGAKHGKKDPENPNAGGDTRHWRFIEFGVPGRGILARAPMRKAALAKQADAYNEFAAQAFKAVTRQLKRANK